MATDGIIVRVRVTPKSSRDGVGGIGDTAEGPAIKVRVRATPEDGAANAAVAVTLAEWLDVPKRSVSLVAGGKSRIKSFAVAGDQGVLSRQIVAKLAPLERDQP